MKTMLIKVLSLVCLGSWLLGSSPARAQASETRTTASYLIGLPTGDTEDFVNNASFLGFELDFGMSLMANQSEASFVVGWQRFDRDLSNSSFTDESTGAVLTADQERSLSYLPFLLKWRYYVPAETTVRWFLSAGAGGAYVERRFFVGSFNFSDYGWQFILRPEGGMTFPISVNSAVEASLRYDFGFDSGDLDELGIVTLGLGYSFFF